MKHIKHLAATVAMLLCCITASGYDFQVDGIFYDITNSTNLTVRVTYETTNFNSYSGDVVIPATVSYNDNTYKVTSIGICAFNACASLTSITIPEGITSVEGQAFYGCSSLTSLTIPESVKSIGGSAFAYCRSLITVNIPEGVTSITSNILEKCSNLTSIIIPESVTSIGINAFRECSSLTSVSIPDGVTSIGVSAFAECKNLTTIILPEKLIDIEDYVFKGCSSLITITIPKNVANIGKYAFDGCSNLTSIFLPEGLSAIGIYAFQNCGSLTSINIPKTLNSIGSSAFHGCASLTAIVIPEGVKSIEKQTFCYCINLTSVTIPKSVTSIGNSAFCNCSNLTSIIIPEGVKSIEDQTFWYCSRLSSVSLPTSLTSIGDYAFANCNNLSSIVLSNSIISIGNYAFEYCSSLSSVVMHQNVTSIGNYTFRECSNLQSITLSEQLVSIGKSAFSGCNQLTTITLPESIVNIGEKAFYNSAKEVVLNSIVPPALTTSSLSSDYTVFVVPSVAFEDYTTATYWDDVASQITKNEIRVKNIEITAAEEKSALHATIGDTNLPYITHLTISGTINSYDFMIMRNKMPLLRHLNLKDASIVYNAYEHYTGYHTENNILPSYALEGCKLYSLILPENITSIGSHAIASNPYLSEIAISEGVTSIKDWAFAYCSDLSSIIIPTSVSSIGSSAFYGCSRLKFITLPDNLESIEYQTFNGCYGITSIALPKKLRNIDMHAFASCSGLTEIHIPSSVYNISDQAFTRCSNLNDVYVYTVEPVKIGQNTFPKNGNNFIGTLHAPKVSYWDYYYDTQWSQFTSFAEFDEPYENFYVEGDKVLDSGTGDIRGEVDNAPDAEMGENSGIIVEDDVEQDLGDVDIEHNGTDGGSIIVGGEGCVNADKLHFHINVKGGRWYFFCFPFDVRSEDIKMEGGAEWVFRYYDGAERAKNGKGGWKNVTSDGDGNHLKAATGYIFQCSKNDVLILTAKNQKIKQEKKYNELVEHITQNAHDASWNFVGNPYLSYYEVSSEDYSAPLTVWDGSKYIAIRPGDDDYQLAPFEAFFVQKPEGVAEVGYEPERQMTYHQSQKAAAQCPSTPTACS